LADECLSELKKDPGIPSLWPFKEKLLHEIEEQQCKVRLIVIAA